jgi:type I restriction enzyme M protein
MEKLGNNSEGITGDELINFIDSNELANKGLFLR